MKRSVPPRLLQIALDGAEVRSIEAGTGPLGYRDCAVIVNGVRPVLADLREKVEALRQRNIKDARDYRATYCTDAYDQVLALIDGDKP